MITVMDMETSYVIVVYNNDVSFTTSALTAISHPRHVIRRWREREERSHRLLHFDKFGLIRSQLMGHLVDMKQIFN